jgi:hypothetical protein
MSPETRSYTWKQKSHIIPQPPLDAFPAFGQLPLELRRMIWLFGSIIEKPPALIRICQFHNPHEGSRWIENIPVRYRMPVVSWVCQESRQVVLKEYMPLHIENAPIGNYETRNYTIFFHRFSGILFLQIDQLNYKPDFRFLNSNEEFYACLRHLRLDARWIRWRDPLQNRVYDEVDSIRYLLNETQKFPRLESLSILIGKDRLIICEKTVQHVLKQMPEWPLRHVSYDNWEWAKQPSINQKRSNFTAAQSTSPPSNMKAYCI